MSEMISIAAYKIQNPIEAPFRVLLRRKRAKQTRNALNSLSASQLTDIGVERADIERIATR